MSHDHGGGTSTVPDTLPRIALVGAPNAGKTSIFNGLAGVHAKTGNYPGVTVSRSVGTLQADGARTMVEDLPGTYGLDAISPDEQIVADVLSGRARDIGQPDAVIAVVDATTLKRSLRFLAQLLAMRRPVCVAVTLTDELAGRGGHIDLAGLGRALGVPVTRVVGNRGIGIPELRQRVVEWRSWPTPPIDPPTDPDELTAWVESILTACDYRPPGQHDATKRLDAVLLHPVFGSLVFLAVMFCFFQVIFTVAAPMQDGIGAFFGWLGGVVDETVHIGWLHGLLGNAIIGGVGNVLVFIPQILLMFLLISLLEGVGYMSRAAFLMDRLMAKAGLEGRAFVALLSSLACAVPGIMSTRTLPSAKDRIATMMAAPLMTCSARLPVYILLTGLLVAPGTRVGPFGAQGVVMFGMYLLGAVTAMTAAWVFKRLGSRHGPVMPFYMEMPPYRIPTLRSVLLSMWESSRMFLRKCGTIILTTTALLWILLNLPQPNGAQLAAAHVDTGNPAAVSAYVIDHSVAARIGRAAEPVFEPLGFDWRVNVGVIASLSARESFVSTLGQVAAAQDPENPHDALTSMTYADGPRRGEHVFTPATIAALLIFFAYALQCMSTVSALRRETGGWRWPLTAFGYLFVLAWSMSFLAHTLVTAIQSGAG
jgi:ferrous iron transport protein B